jgi:hypothetical protein
VGLFVVGRRAPAMAPGGAVIQSLSALASVMGSLAQSAGSGTIKSVIGVIGELLGIIYKIDALGVNAISAMTGIGSVFEAFGRLPFEVITSSLASVNSGLAGFAGMIERVRNALGIGGAEAKPVDPTFNDRFDALKHPMRFDPGTSTTKATPIALSLNVDGRVLAQSMSEQLEQLYEHATGARPAFRAGSSIAG